MVEEGSAIPGFRGAYTASSTNWLPDDAELISTSDLDIMVILAGRNPPGARRKFLYNNVLLEVSYLQQDQFQSPEMVLKGFRGMAAPPPLQN